MAHSTIGITQPILRPWDDERNANTTPSPSNASLLSEGHDLEDCDRSGGHERVLFIPNNGERYRGTGDSSTDGGYGSDNGSYVSRDDGPLRFTRINGEDYEDSENGDAQDDNGYGSDNGSDISRDGGLLRFTRINGERCEDSSEDGDAQDDDGYGSDNGSDVSESPRMSPYGGAVPINNTTNSELTTEDKDFLVKITNNINALRSIPKSNWNAIAQEDILRLVQCYQKSHDPRAKEAITPLVARTPSRVSESIKHMDADLIPALHEMLTNNGKITHYGKSVLLDSILRHIDKMTPEQQAKSVEIAQKLEADKETMRLFTAYADPNHDRPIQPDDIKFFSLLHNKYADSNRGGGCVNTAIFGIYSALNIPITLNQAINISTANIRFSESIPKHLPEGIKLANIPLPAADSDADTLRTHFEQLSSQYDGILVGYNQSKTKDKSGKDIWKNDGHVQFIYKKDDEFFYTENRNGFGEMGIKERALDTSPYLPKETRERNQIASIKAVQRGRVEV